MVGLDSPLDGLARAAASFDQASGRIAQAPVAFDPNQQDQVSLSDAAVALVNSRDTYETNLQTVRTASQMQKTSVDLVG